MNSKKKKSLQKELTKLIGYHYGFGDLNHWNNTATDVQKKDVDKLAKIIIAHLEDNEEEFYD